MRSIWQRRLSCGGINKDERRLRQTIQSRSQADIGLWGVPMNSTASLDKSARQFASGNSLDFDHAVAEVIDRYGELIMRDAVRYSANREDAEDAYQAAIEVLLKKGPSDRPAQLVPWLRTVVRHEAHHIARARHKQQRGLTAKDFDQIPRDGRSPEDVAEAFAEVEMSFEALARLSDDQKRCMIAQAGGLEYDEIAELTGFTRRKVSRCLQRGREAFARRLDAIAEGSECERMQPLIHRVLDSDPGAALELRPHLRHCGACRARLRTYQEAPHGVAAILGPAVLGPAALKSIASAGESEAIGLVERIASWWGSIADRIAVQLLGADRWVEVATAKKAVAIVAVATATASGGTAVKQATDAVRDSRERHPAAVGGAAASGHRPLTDRLRVDPIDRATTPHGRGPQTQQQRRPAQQPAPSPAPQQTEVDDGSAEFAPEGAP
jgi:RNA polymerase sigma factor (sigma-70 family)